MPRKMFPPPMTTATSTPSRTTSAISSAMRPIVSGSMPYPWPPASASPDSLSRMRRYAAAGPGAAMGGLALAHLEAGEPLHHDALAHLGGRLVHHVLHPGLARRVADERLLHQAGLGVELLELAVDDLVEDLGRLLLVGHLLPVDLALLLDHRAR